MQKKEFINLVESLDAEFCSIRKKDKSLSEALGTWITLFEPMGRLMDITINSLMFAVNDEDSWIDHYIYELDFGRKYKKGCVKLNGKDFKLKTASDLWDLINSNK
jgi:hypothetical protein